VFNPTREAVERRLDTLLPPDERDLDLPELQAVVEEEYAKGDYKPGAREVRLDVFHNYRAADPRLLRGTFNGPNDREFDVEGGLYQQVSRLYAMKRG
ncbi:MAG TPA: hypothetical protein VN636_18990, partial [Acidimicrobiia bacterium]|nr:hypothetical protein [Acidimicrobiia bacterium]